MASDNTDYDYSIQSEVSDYLFSPGEWQNDIEDFEVTPSKSEESKVCQLIMSVWINLLYIPMNQWLMKTC